MKSEISKELETTYIGKNIFIFNEVASTNTVAKFLSMNDIEHGTVIISEKQTQAKGRSGKSWESPLGGVWLSIVLSPNVDYSKLPNIIVGVGIDANLDVEDFPEELQIGTTTLKEELGKTGDENLLIKLFLEEFEKISELFREQEYELILKEWRKRSYTIGKIVEVREPFNTYYDAYVVGLGKEGALIVEKIDGTLEKVISGECIIKN